MSDHSPAAETCDTLILGAGISGLVAAMLFIKQGQSSVSLIDSYPQVGGNHIDVQVGAYTFDVGTFIFQNESPLLRHFPDLVPLYTEVSATISRVTPAGAVHGYPISAGAEIFGAGPLEWLRIAASLAWGRLTRRSKQNAEDFLHFWMGRRLAAITGVENYVRRFYGVAADQIDIKFAEKRMEWIADGASLKKRLARLMGYKDPWGHSPSLVRPREGFATLYQPAADRIRLSGGVIHLGQALKSLRRDGDHFVLSTAQGDFVAKKVVSTLPLHQALALCGLRQLYALPTLSLTTLMFSFEGIRGFDTYILYNFSEAGSWKRITMFSDAYGRVEGREYFGVEINHDGADAEGPSEERAEQDAANFVADMAEKGLFRGDLRLETYHVLHNAYLVYMPGAAEQAAQAIAALEAFCIRSIGRQGGFDYLPAARATTLTVEEALLGQHGPYTYNPEVAAE